MTRPGGGVLIACRNTTTCKELGFAINCEVVVCKITLQNNRHLIICSFYRPPDSEASYVTELCSVFREISNTCKNSVIWLATKKKCRTAHINYLANSLSNHSGSKRLWSYIKSKKKDQNGV